MALESGHRILVQVCAFRCDLVISVARCICARDRRQDSVGSEELHVLFPHSRTGYLVIVCVRSCGGFDRDPHRRLCTHEWHCLPDMAMPLLRAPVAAWFNMAADCDTLGVDGIRT